MDESPDSSRQSSPWRRILAGIVAVTAIVRLCSAFGEERSAADNRQAAATVVAPLRSICREAGGIPSGPLHALCTYPGYPSDLPVGCTIERLRPPSGTGTATARPSPSGVVPAATAPRGASATRIGVATVSSGWTALPFRVGFPRAVARDATGNFYVADGLFDIVFKFSPSGARLDGWRFHDPVRVAIAPDGGFYVTDAGAHCVHRIARTGEPVARWGVAGSEPGQFQWPVGVAVDSAGEVYVVDGGNNRVQKFTPAGEYRAAWGAKGTEPGSFDRPVDVAVDRAGNVYVTDGDNHRVQKLTADGLPVASRGGRGPAPGQFSDPSGLTLDPAGNLYVVDRSNHRVQQFSPTGEPLAQWPGTSWETYGIYVDARGTIYVADTGNNAVRALARGR